MQHVTWDQPRFANATTAACLAVLATAFSLGGCLAEDLRDDPTLGTPADTAVDTGVDTAAAPKADADTTSDATKAGEVANLCAGPCDDENPCTIDDCDPKLGCIHAKLPDGSTCGAAACDGKTWSPDRQCLVGFCQPAPKTVCDDGNPCTDNGCDPPKGCTQTFSTGACDDGDACTGSEACSGGACVKGSPKLCDDGNACTVDVCDPGKGCTASPATDGAPCAQPSCEGAVWTGAKSCQAGICAAAASAKNCDDNNPCTTNSCAAAIGCANAATASACDDGNLCTTADVCTNGQCTPGLAKTCDDGSLCTLDSCVAAIGCTYAPTDGVCSDNSLCTVQEVCVSGSCTGKPLACEDGNPCTQDSCVPQSGCTYTAISGACDDANPCTKGDACAASTCKGSGGPNCDDGQPCTKDSCSLAGGCSHAPLPDGSTCSDATCVGGNWQGPAFCKVGACAAKPASIVCNDGNPCTLDVCSAATGCLHANQTGSCSDGAACIVTGQCSSGLCAATAPVCADGNACTKDGCVAGKCSNAAVAGSCDDGNSCTTNDLCSAAQCKGTAPAAGGCGDGNPCTSDVCDPVKGCQYVQQASGCEDGNACTKGDLCAAGACSPGAKAQCTDGNSCTNDGCDPAKGCVYSPASGSCDDGSACTAADLCASGTCTPGPAIACDDTNPCTTDTCDPSKGCSFAPNALPCSDSNLCTAGDNCASGVCKSGTTVNCDDGNACTTDNCAAKAGCANVANAASCSDGNPCTTTDSCAGGLCKGSGGPSCDDGKPCTLDTCDAKTGACANPTSPDGSVCAQGVCTGLTLQAESKCQVGSCVAPAAKACGDGNACTDDTCHGQQGCLNPPNGAACNDANPCTVKDKCAGGSCAGTTQGACDDGNACTVDSCSSVAGCAYAPLDKGPCEDGNACTAPDLCNKDTCKPGLVVVCTDSNTCTDDNCVPATGCVYAPNTVACNDDNACTGGESCALGKCSAGKPLLFKKAYGGAGPDVAFGIAAFASGALAWFGRTATTTTSTTDGWMAWTTATAPYQDIAVAKTLGTASQESFYAGAPLAAGGAVAVGEKPGTVAGTTDGWLVVTSATGSVTLDVALGGIGSDQLRGVRALSEAYVAVGTWNAGADRFWITKVDLAGAIKFSKQPDLGATTLARAVAMDVLADGTYCVAGHSKLGPTANWDLQVVRFDTGGTTKWARSVPLAGDDIAGGVAGSTLDESCIIAGTTRVNGTADIVVARVHKDAVLWTTISPGPAEEGALAIAGLASGGFAVAGYSGGSLVAGQLTGPLFYYDRRDAFGNVLWSRNEGAGQALAIAALADGGLAVAGETQATGGRVLARPARSRCHQSRKRQRRSFAADGPLLLARQRARTARRAGIRDHSLSAF